MRANSGVNGFNDMHALSLRAGDRPDGKKFGVGYVTVPKSLEQQIYVDLFQAMTEQYPKPYRSLNAFALEVCCVDYLQLVRSNVDYQSSDTGCVLLYFRRMCTTGITLSRASSALDARNLSTR